MCYDDGPKSLLSIAFFGTSLHAPGQANAQACDAMLFWTDSKVFDCYLEINRDRGGELLELEWTAHRDREGSTYEPTTRPFLWDHPILRANQVDLSC